MSLYKSMPFATIAGNEIAAVRGNCRANLITDFYGTLLEVAAGFEARRRIESPAGTVIPAFALPGRGAATTEFFRSAEVSWQEFGSYRGHTLTLLNLSRNPSTHTTKTFPSLLIVARAIEHIHRTGEPILIFTPTSANKGTALRHAVWRALKCGLAEPDQLRVAVLAPRVSANKLRADDLADDSATARLNPVFVLDSPVAEDVKALGRQFVTDHAEQVASTTGARLWFSLELDNYALADTARAMFEHAAAPVDLAHRHRTHVHAVSSAFGMLGYHRGRQLLEDAGLSAPERRPHTLLVQHLGTPDMVLDLHFGSFERSAMPEYRRDAVTGLYRQDSDVRFPAATGGPDEVLDTTFYTHKPATAQEMSGLIRRYGGDGIVVSRHECMIQYGRWREAIQEAGFIAPEDTNVIREWSLMMALTGATLGIDRGLVKPDHDLVIHGSGWYTDADYRPLTDLVKVATAQNIADRLCGPANR